MVPATTVEEVKPTVRRFAEEAVNLEQRIRLPHYRVSKHSTCVYHQSTTGDSTRRPTSVAHCVSIRTTFRSGIWAVTPLDTVNNPPPSGLANARRSPLQ